MVKENDMTLDSELRCIGEMKKEEFMMRNNVERLGEHMAGRRTRGCRWRQQPRSASRAG
jgi:hypothetical protein